MLQHIDSSQESDFENSSSIRIFGLAHVLASLRLSFLHFHCIMYNRAFCSIAPTWYLHIGQCSTEMCTPFSLSPCSTHGARAAPSSAVEHREYEAVLGAAEEVVLAEKTLRRSLLQRFRVS